MWLSASSYTFINFYTRQSLHFGGLCLESHILWFVFPYYLFQNILQEAELLSMPHGKKPAVLPSHAHLLIFDSNTFQVQLCNNLKSNPHIASYSSRCCSGHNIKTNYSNQTIDPDYVRCDGLLNDRPQRSADLLFHRDNIFLENLHLIFL